MDNSKVEETVQVITNAPQIPAADKPEPIAKMPNPKCSRCHGRGHLGKDLKTGKYVRCVCVYTDEEAKARRARIQAEELYHRMHGRR